MLRKHEIDLIAGLVEGELEDESEARALIERSAEARAEYEAQRTAFEALRTEGTVAMTEAERAALHRDVWTALRHEPQATATKTPWYNRLAPVAAALFVVIGLAAVLSQGVLSQQAGDEATAESFGEISRGLSADTTEGDDGGDVESADTAQAFGEGEDGDGAADMTDEEAAPTAPSLPEEQFAQIAEMVRSGDVGNVDGMRSLVTSAELEEASSCLETAGVGNYMILGEVLLEDDQGSDDAEYFVVVQSNDDLGPDTQVIFIDTASCQIAHVED